MADPTSTIDMLLGVSGGAGGTGVVGYGLYRIFGKPNGSDKRLEGKMDQMIEQQQDGNLLLAEIKGLLSNRSL